jgi:lipoprotein NlpI
LAKEPHIWKSIERHPVPVLFVIVLITSGFFAPSLFNGWTNWDDHYYILNNPMVKAISWENLKAMFSTMEFNGSYNPLALASWSIDYQIYGEDAFGYHLSNLLLHITNTFLVWVFIKRLTGSIALAAGTALLFGIHPMHVEPVAWITARKDLLAGTFVLISLTVWNAYLSRRSTGLYFLCLLFFLLSLFSKGTVVILPLLLLLMDVFHGRTDFANVTLEKIPFFGLSLIFGLLAIDAQQSTPALGSLVDISMARSFQNALRSIEFYVIQSVFPSQMGAFHPYPPVNSSIPWSSIVVNTALLVIVAVAIVRKMKIVWFGLSFFLCTIMPTIQLIPVGGALVADRYSYISFIGLFLISSYGLSKLVTSRSPVAVKGSVGAVFIGFLCWLGITSALEIKTWKNSETLWTNVIKHHPESPIPYMNRGRYYRSIKELNLAEKDFLFAKELNPTMPQIYQELGLYYQTINELTKAHESFNEALLIDSTYTPALLNRGLNHLKLGNKEKALIDLQRVSQIDKSNVLGHLNKGVIFEADGLLQLAIEEYSIAIRKEARNPTAYRYRAVAHFKNSNLESARSDALRWAELVPSDAMAYRWLARIEFGLASYDKALEYAMKAEHLGGPLPESEIRDIRQNR